MFKIILPDVDVYVPLAIILVTVYVSSIDEPSPSKTSIVMLPSPFPAKPPKPLTFTGDTVFPEPNDIVPCVSCLYTDLSVLEPDQPPSS